MKVLVTGQTGFVGTHFTARIGAENVVGFPHAVDLTKLGETSDFVRGQTFDAVLHLAARSSVAESFTNPQATRDVNVEGTRNLLYALRERKFTGPVLLVSSGEVYGAVAEENLPVNESMPPAPHNPYAESKVAMEALVKEGGEFASAPFRAMIARPFNHIGPGQSETFVIANFMAQLVRRKLGLESGPMKTGDLTVTRDFTDVRDIVAAYEALLHLGRAGEAYNLGSGTETRLDVILGTLIEISGTSTRYEIDPARLRAGEQRRMCADISKIQGDIGWRPRIPLRQTLQDGFDAALKKIQNEFERKI